MRRNYTPRVKKNKNSVIKTNDKRAKVLNSIKDYYGGLKISENVHNIKLNMRKFWYNDQHLWESDIKKVYEKYNIAYYANKGDFMKAKEPLELTEVQKETLWQDYEYRHKLIVSGQYDEYRINLFKENYIKGMRRLGASEQEIEILQGMSSSQWDLLQDIPQPSKDNIKDTKLPPLGLFNYDDASMLSKVRKDIAELLKDEFNIDYTWDDDSSIRKSLKYLPRLIRPEDRDDLIDSDNEIEVYTDMIRHVPFEKLKQNKKGMYYIRGVGSEQGKNSQLIKDILHEYGIK